MCWEWSGKADLNYHEKHESHSIYKIAYPILKLLQTYEKDFNQKYLGKAKGE